MEKCNKNTFLEKMVTCESMEDLRALFKNFDMEIDEDELQILFHRKVLSEYVKLGNYNETELADLLIEKKTRM